MQVNKKIKEKNIIIDKYEQRQRKIVTLVYSHNSGLEEGTGEATWEIS